MNIWAVSGSEVTAWVAAIAGIVALGVQGWGAFRKRRKERDEIEEALDHSPEVRHQLELGNVGEAVKVLNVIIESQAKHTIAQDERLAAAYLRIEHLEDRNEALENEAEGWEKKYNEAVAKLVEAQKTYARSLAVIRDQKGELP